MAKVAVIAKLTAAPGKREELVAAFASMLDAVEQESGTLVYALNTDKGNADLVWFYELYEDDAALAAHSGSDAMKAVGGKLGGLLGGAPELFMLSLEGGKGLPV